MAKLLKGCLCVLLLALVFVASADRSEACPFCNADGKTLTGEVKDATMVLYGTLKDAKADQETTVLVIEKVIKKPENAKLLGDGKTITLNRYLPDDSGKYRYLVFCDDFKGRIDPYYGIAVKVDSDIAKYLEAALKLAEEKQPKRLRFFFDYLDNDDVEISNDALKEYGKADYADYKEMAKTLPADKIAGWLRDPKTPAFRYGLYASLLGHCGKEQHADLLRDMLKDNDKLLGAGVDGMMAAYTMLKPKEGWEFITASMRDSKKQFMIRYNALKAVRFFHEYRPDLVKEKDLAESLTLLIEQKDLADMAIEELRKWKSWDKADRILALRTHEVYDVPVIRRSILRYAIECKGSKECAAHVAAMREKDPEMVRDAEELLRLQQENTPNGK